MTSSAHHPKFANIETNDTFDDDDLTLSELTRVKLRKGKSKREDIGAMADDGSDTDWGSLDDGAEERDHNSPK